MNRTQQVHVKHTEKRSFYSYIQSPQGDHPVEICNKTAISGVGVYAENSYMLFRPEASVHRQKAPDNVRNSEPGSSFQSPPCPAGNHGLSGGQLPKGWSVRLISSPAWYINSNLRQHPRSQASGCYCLLILSRCPGILSGRFYSPRLPRTEVHEYKATHHHCHLPP